MPVPRLFEASNEPREQWVHVLATLLTLGGPETRTALVEEISGEALPGADALLVFEQRPLRGGPEGLLADVVARGAGWTIAIQSTLAFDADEEARLTATHDALADVYDKVILVAVTPDRKPSPAVERAAAGDRDVRHRSWLRVRDWVQERPERGRAQGTDLLLLREAEYFFTPRVAELYRLEGLMPMVSQALRPEPGRHLLRPQRARPGPAGAERGGRRARSRSRAPERRRPRSPSSKDGMSINLASAESGPGYDDAGEGWKRLVVGDAGDYLAARAWTQSTAKSLLPARR